MSDSHYMLDTNTASYIIRKHDTAVDNKLRQVSIGNVCISAVTEAELRFGCARHPQRTQLNLLVDSFLSRVDRLAWDSEAALAYAHIRAESQAKGVNLSNMDLLIGAHSAAIDATLITNDSAFSHFQEWLSIENWMTL